MKNLQFIILILASSLFSFNVAAQSNWSLISEPGTDVFISNEDIAYSFYHEPIGSHGNKYTILKSTDGCRNFSPIYSKSGDFGCYYLDELYFVNSELGFISELCQGMAYILKTLDGGNTWDYVGYGGSYGMSLCFLNENLGYYSFFPGSPNSSYLKRNGDDLLVTKKYIFAKDSYEYPEYNTVIKFVNDSTGFINCMDSLNNAVILKTNNYGDDWTEKLVLTGKILKDITFLSDSVGLAIGTNGTIIKTTDQGETWIPVSSNTQKTLNSIDFASSGVCYIAGEDGLILNSGDYGNTWQTLSFPYTKDLIYIRVFNNNHVYVTALDGKLYANFSGVGITENILNKLAIFPNPANDILNVIVPEASNNYSIKILNSQGKEMLVTTMNEISISKLSPGIYFITVQTEEGLFRNTFIKE